MDKKSIQDRDISVLAGLAAGDHNCGSIQMAGRLAENLAAKRTLTVLISLTVTCSGGGMEPSIPVPRCTDRGRYH